jgi:MFS family permease
MIVISPLGDKNGRRHTILLLLVLGCVGISTLIFGIYRKLWVVITVGQFLNGASTNGLGNLTLIYASEFLSKKGCRAFINCCWIIWCIGFMLFMPVY